MAIARVLGFHFDKPEEKPVVEAEKSVDFQTQLVRLANTRHYVDVLDYLHTLPSVPLKKISASDAEKLFSVVLNGDHFDSKNKYDILILCFYRGYEEHYLLLLEKPLITAMLQHPQLCSILLLCYQCATRNDKVDEVNDNLKDIWQVLFKAKEDYFWVIVRDIFKHQNGSSNVHFIAIFQFWLKTMTDFEQIRRGVLKLKDMVESVSGINLVSEDIVQLGRIRIYELFLFETKDIALSNVVKEFLGFTRIKESIFTRKATKSENLFNLIMRNPTLAQVKLNEVRQQITDKVSSRNNIPIMFK